MNRVPVKSSNILSVGYNPDKRLLEIEFTTGVYRYADVPPAVYNALLAAPSAGSFVHKQIRPFYVAAKVEVAEVPGACGRVLSEAGQMTREMGPNERQVCFGWYGLILPDDPVEREEFCGEMLATSASMKRDPSGQSLRPDVIAYWRGVRQERAVEMEQSFDGRRPQEAN